MNQLLGMNPGALLIYGLIVLGILYLIMRFIGENKGKVFLGLLGIVVLVIFFRTPLQEAGWLPTEFKGPLAKAETLPSVIVPGEVVPGQPAPNLPDPAPNLKEDQQLPIPQLNGDFKIASSQSGCEVPSVWQKDSYYPESFQRAGCGPASVAMLLISQGFLNATKEAVKQLALDSYGDVWDNSGSNGVGALARLLNSQSENKLNAKGRTDVPWNEVLKLVQKAPTIVGIYSTEYPYYYPYGHYLVVLKIESDYVLANDPYAPAGEDFERQFPLEKFKSYYEAAGSKLVEIDPIACGTEKDSDLQELSPVISLDGYVFPLLVDLTLVSWTHNHWSGTNEVDIEAAPDISYEDYQRFAQSKILAVTAGKIEHKDRTDGGTTITLYGDDGRQYYYAHLSRRIAPDGARVKAGDVIGVIGNTGRWTRYLEVHLHFAIISAVGSFSNPDVNGAEELLRWTGKQWLVIPASVDYPEDAPTGSPIVGYPWRITKTFQEHAQEDSDTGAVDIDIDPSSPNYNQPDIDVHTTMAGTVNIIRWNPIYGDRVQVTNEKSKYTVVFSHLSEFYVKDFEVVQKGQAIGKWGTTGNSSGPHVDYILFDPSSNLIDPTDSLYK